MGKMKGLCIIVALLVIGFAVPVQAADFPTKDISGIIQWGAGGATDNVSRATTPYVEKVLGKQIVLQNKPGATGAIGLMQVYNRPQTATPCSTGRRTPASTRSWTSARSTTMPSIPVMLIARNVGVIVVNNDQPWKTLGELFADAKKNPGKIKMGSTGPGGLPHVVSSMLKATSGVEFNHTIYQGEGPLTTAILGGHIQWSTMGMAAVPRAPPGGPHPRPGRGSRYAGADPRNRSPDHRHVCRLQEISPLGSLLRRLREEGDPRRGEEGPGGCLQEGGW